MTTLRSRQRCEPLARDLWDLGVLRGDDFEFFVRRSEFEAALYSAFCQQWIAIGWAAIVGHE